MVWDARRSEGYQLVPIDCGARRAAVIPVGSYIAEALSPSSLCHQSEIVHNHEAISYALPAYRSSGHT